MQTSYYPMEFADRGAERLRSARNINEGTVQYLAGTLHIRQVGYRDRITVCSPNPTETDFFKLPPDGRVPMYEITRTAYDGHGQPMRVTVTVYPADRNQFILNVGWYRIVGKPRTFSNTNPNKRILLDGILPQWMTLAVLALEQESASYRLRPRFKRKAEAG